MFTIAQRCRTGVHATRIVSMRPRGKSRHSSTLLKPHIDLKRVRENIDYIQNNIANRKSQGDARSAAALYDQWVALQQRGDKLRAERNHVAKDTTLSPQDRQAAGKRIKEELHNIEALISDAKDKVDLAALQLPCDSHPDAPVGPEPAAREILQIGTPRQFDFKPKDHYALAQHLHLADFEAGANITGSSFVVFKNDGVLLELALVQWALHKLVEAGFTPVSPPDLAQTSLVEGCGFNPRDTSRPEGGVSPSQVYLIAGSPLALIGTSEIPLCGLHANQLLEGSQLPRLYAGFSHCFRHEAGGGGVGNRGLYRLHQFSKVEMFAFVAPESDPKPHLERVQEPSLIGSLVHSSARDPAPPSAAAAPSPSGPAVAPPGPQQPSPASEALFARLVDLQIQLVRELGLHARVLDMPTEELGASAYRKVDIEVWMPGRTPSPAPSTPATAAATAASSTIEGSYGEISSASNCVDYQARRLNIRYKAGAKDNRFVHTLNATGVAVPRLILAILETHQQPDGSVVLPECLRPWMRKDVLRPPTSGGAGR